MTPLLRPTRDGFLEVSDADEVHIYSLHEEDLPRRTILGSRLEYSRYPMHAAHRHYGGSGIEKIPTRLIQEYEELVCRTV